MIKAIIFDCFGVLYVNKGVEFTAAHVPQDKKQAVADLDKQSNLGMLDQDEYEAAISEITGLDLAVVHEGLIASFDRNKALLDYAQSLRKKYKIALLSNIGKGDMRNYFTEDELKQYFDVVVLSSDAGIMKPFQEAYWMTCEKLDTDPSETIMVDDVLENVVGAELAGLHAVHYQETNQAKNELENLLAKHA